MNSLSNPIDLSQTPAQADSSTLPQADLPNSPLNRLQAKWTSKAQGRSIWTLSLDRETTSALCQVQALDFFQLPDARIFSRTALVRRALALYCRQILQADRADDELILERERRALLAMTQCGPRQVKKAEPV